MLSDRSGYYMVRAERRYLTLQRDRVGRDSTALGAPARGDFKALIQTMK